MKGLDTNVLVRYLVQDDKKQVVWRALDDYKNSNADFPDHLLARVNESVGCKSTVTLHDTVIRAA